MQAHNLGFTVFLSGWRQCYLRL